MRQTVPQPDPAEPESITELLRAAHTGSQAALGRLLDGCREYLLLIANQELGRDLRSKVGASDVVQETFVDAQRDFVRFSGQSRGDLLVWLRTMLLHNLRDTERRYRTAGRDISREVPLKISGEISDAGPVVPTNPETPSWLMRLDERDDCVRQALEALPCDYRDVLVSRNLELQSFVQIGARMGRSADAVRKLWVRAIEALQEQLERHDAW